MVWLVVKGGDTILIAYALQDDAERYAALYRLTTTDSVQVIAVELGETRMGMDDA